jgi:hypothetical protein
MIVDDVNPLADYVCSDTTEYNTFYGLGLWRDAFKLYHIGRQVVLFMREPIDLDDDHWKKKLQNLDQKLVDWKRDASPLITKAYDHYSLDYEQGEYPSYYAGFIYSLFHTLRILLYKPVFLYNLEHEKFKHGSIAIVKASAMEIAKVFRAFSPAEPYFRLLPFCSYYFIYLYASILCFLTLVSVPRHFQESLDVSLKFLDHYVIMTPQIAFRVQFIKQYLKNPKEEIKNFGSFV